MAIYELGLLLDGKILLEKKYYDSKNQLDSELRAGLLSAIDGFAKEAFNTELESFTLSSYTIVAISQSLLEPGSYQDKNAPTHRLMMFSIIDKITEEKVVKKLMNEALNQFLNRYSTIDILSREPKYFAKFADRFDKIFSDLILKTEHRFESIL